jgi:hypothetical protein
LSLLHRSASRNAHRPFHPFQPSRISQHFQHFQHFYLDTRFLICGNGAIAATLGCQGF